MAPVIFGYVIRGPDRGRGGGGGERGGGVSFLILCLLLNIQIFGKSVYLIHVAKLTKLSVPI
jgi:hypothetical protein